MFTSLNNHSNLSKRGISWSPQQVRAWKESTRQLVNQSSVAQVRPQKIQKILGLIFGIKSKEKYVFEHSKKICVKIKVDPTLVPEEE